MYILLYVYHFEYFFSRLVYRFAYDVVINKVKLDASTVTVKIERDVLEKALGFITSANGEAYSLVEVERSIVSKIVTNEKLTSVVVAGVSVEMGVIAKFTSRVKKVLKANAGKNWI